MKIAPVAGFLFAALLALISPVWARDTGDTARSAPAGDYLEDMKRGDALYGRGRTLVWTGAALIPLSLLAFVPVLFDGAFGITAADPGFGGYIGAAGLGLIHIGIPLLGLGADRLESGAKGANPGFQPRDSSSWSLYGRSWALIGAGAAILAVSIPFVAVAALDWSRDDAPVDYIALGLVYSGLGLGVAGILEQEYCGYRFYRRRRDAKDASGGLTSLSLRPVLRLGRDGDPGAGLNLMAVF